MLIRLMIQGQPKGNPNKAEKAGQYEGPLPAVPQCYQRDCKSSYNHTDVGARIKDTRGSGSLLFWKPFCGGLDSGGKIATLSEAEREPRDAEAQNRSGQRVTHCCDTPEDYGQSITDPGAQFVHQAAGDDESPRVCELKPE